MNIVCATDDNFVQHCCIMLVSLLCNNKDVNIFILTEGLTDENRCIIEEEVSAKGGHVHFCIVDSSLIENMPMSKVEGLNHISRATYYRLLIADILPQDIDRVLYLDCDIVVNDSLDDFWNIDMTDKAIAAVPQIGSGYECERLGYPIENGYFNAGVTMMNLDYCRSHHITEEMLAYVEQNHDRLRFNDQDVLNGVLYDRCVHMLPQWNMTSACYVYELDKRGDKRNGVVINDYAAAKKNIKERGMNPSIVHYVSRPKPWSNNCVHPLYHLYYDYAKQTLHYTHLIPQDEQQRQKAVRKEHWLSVLSAIKQRIHKTDPTRM